MVLVALLSGVLPLGVSAGAFYVLATQTDLAPLQCGLYAAGLGLAMALILVLVAMVTGRRLEEEISRETEQARQWAAERMASLQEAAGPTARGGAGASGRVGQEELRRLAEVLASGPDAAGSRTLLSPLGRFLEFMLPRRARPRKVDVNAAVAVCVAALQPSAGARLEFDPDPNAGQAPVDPDAFHQVLLNLILNAREAAGPEGRVSVRTQMLSDEVLVAVRDDGPGVPPEEMERIFEPFRTTRPGALGLGLPLCRQIAAAHGGAVDVTNIHPHGLEVGLRLPLAGRAAGEAATRT